MSELIGNNIMLDLETMGNSSNSAITAIGAVRFNSTSGVLEDSFHEFVDLDSSVEAGLNLDTSTVLWWMKQSDAARKQFEEKGKSLHSVLDSFSKWIGGDAIVWGNGVGFDNVILANAYRTCKVKQPWQFYNDRCYRTIKNMHKDIKLERVGTHHDAVDDAKSQALHLIKILETTTK